MIAARALTICEKLKYNKDFEIYIYIFFSQKFGGEFHPKTSWGSQNILTPSHEAA